VKRLARNDFDIDSDGSVALELCQRGTHMNTPQQPEPRPADLEDSIKRRIVERTGDRIHDLEVEVTAARIEIRGRAVSFYIKQLATEGTLDVIGCTGSRHIDVNIQVERKLLGSSPIAS
jgi:hypothetical protein